MGKLILLILIFSLNLGFSVTSYELRVEKIWDELVACREVDPSCGYLVLDGKAFLEKTSPQLSKNDKILISFYPKGSGFDHLVEDDSSFMEIKDFFDLAKELGFKVNFCMPHRHMATFENIEELKEFVEMTFHATLKSDGAPLFFPTKIVILELIKQ